MHSEPTYLAARMVAPALAEHFAQHHAAARQPAATLPPLPGAALIEAVIDVAFWASLRREEGRPPRISLALVGPQDVAQPLRFGERRRLNPYTLIKLAPAVEHPGIHLGVGYDEAADELYVWGTTTQVPPVALVLEVVEPGLLVAKHRRADGFGKFMNVAVLRGDQVQLLDERSHPLADCPALQSLVQVVQPAVSIAGPTADVLVELARAMRAHGRGGLALLVPPHSERWRESIAAPLGYPIEPAYGALASLLQQPEQQRPEWQQELLRHLELVGGFTAVDGATVLSFGLTMLAFGAKVARKAEGTPVAEVLTSAPLVDDVPQRVPPTRNGGTRHLAAAQFVHDQPDAVALVASQDGNFTIFAWSESLRVVRAHRIEMLLL